MKERAPAKVNLCLFLGPVRSDGRHELVTLFESISLADELELTVLEGGPDEVVCPGVEGPNLVAAALAELRERGWTAPPVRIEITKRIPVAAGLGGGSADAAAALRLARTVAPPPEGATQAIARQLGADVASQLEPGLALGTGAGDELRRVPPLTPHAFVIVPQPFPLSTADVYREADRLGLPRPAGELPDRLGAVSAAVAAGGRLAGELLVNDLERATVSLAPDAAMALDDLRRDGAAHALVCGSGPTVMGIHWGPEASALAAKSARRLSPKHPGAVSATPISASQ